MANNIPSRIKVDSSKYGMFLDLRKNLSDKVVNSDVFSLSVAYGYKSENKVPLKSKKDFINVISVSDELNSLILFIGLTELGEKAIENPSEMYVLAEKYANGGIDELYEDFTKSNGEFSLKMYDELMNINEK